MLSVFALTADADNKPTDLPRGTVEGFLDNGLHYIILPNALPRHDVEMRLVMRVGSLQESDRQKGGAHFLEHMSFAGTTHFPGDSWVDYFERLGMKYGRDINAFTGFDRTIYWLSLPVADMGSRVMDNTLLAIRDILDGITFDSARIEKERGVIKEELRGYSTGDDFYDLKIGTGRYIQRMPLGSEHDIETISRPELLDFYGKWYQPGNACLVIVGNVDADDMQKRIQNVFGTLKEGKRNKLDKYPLIYKKGVTLLEVRDTVDRTSKLEFIIPHTCVVGNTVASTALKEQYRLLVNALTKRLAAWNVRCDINDAWYLADQNHFSITVEADSKKMLKERMLRAIGALNQVANTGFQQEELADYVTEKVNRMRTDTAGMQSAEWCDNFVDYIIAGDRHVISAEDMEKVKDIVSTSDNALMQKLLKSILGKAKQTLLAAYQNNAGGKDSFTEKELARLWRDGLSTHLPPFNYQHKEVKETPKPAIPRCLAATHPDTAAIMTEKTYQDMGATAYTLNNGMRIILRPTTDKDSTIYMAMIGRGGLNDLDSHSYPLLKDAASYVDMGGLAHVPADSLTETMMHENLSMSVGIDEYWHQVLASAPADKPQALMNMVYEKITAPGKAYEDFEEVRRTEYENFGKETLLDRLLKRDADRMLSRTIDSLACNLPTNLAETTKEDLNNLNLDSMTVYYTSLFGNPKQTTLIFTGNFNSQQVLKAAVNTFSRLQHTCDMPQFDDQPCSMPTSYYTQGFDNEVPTQTVLNYIYPGNYQPGLKQSLTLKLMRDVMQARLLNILREQMNIVYSPYADLYYSGVPQAKYYFWLTVAVQNENRAKADRAIQDIVEELQTHCIGETELEKLKMSFLVTKRKSLSDDVPAEWKNLFVSLVRNGESMEEYDNYTQCLQTITPEDIRQGFENYVKQERRALLYKGKTL